MAHVAFDGSGEPASISYALTYSGFSETTGLTAVWRAVPELRIGGDNVVVPLRREVEVSPAQHEALWNAMRKSSTLISAGHFAGEAP